MRILASALIGSARSLTCPSSDRATALLGSDLAIDSATSRPVTPGLNSRREPSGNCREIICLSSHSCVRAQVRDWFVATPPISGIYGRSHLEATSTARSARAQRGGVRPAHRERGLCHGCPRDGSGRAATARANRLSTLRFCRSPPAHSQSRTAGDGKWRRGAALSRRDGSGSWVRLTVLSQEHEAASLLPRHHVDVAILSLLTFSACADFEVECWPITSIDQVMPIVLAGGEARRHPCSEHCLPGVRNERHLSLQDINELVLVCVPMALRGPAPWSEGYEIDSELGELERITQRLLLAAGQLVAERAGIDAAQSGRHDRRIEPGLALRFRLLHQRLLSDLKRARPARGLPAPPVRNRSARSRPLPRRTRAASRRGAPYSL